MYKEEREDVVLNNFDLATMEECEIGNQRTGTVLFMAIDLLTEQGLAGKIKHVYAYDTELFMWVLMWVSLCYDNGQLCINSHHPFNQWLKVHTVRCREEKKDFLFSCQWQEMKATNCHGYNWKITCTCLKKLCQHHTSAMRIPTAKIWRGHPRRIHSCFKRIWSHLRRIWKSCLQGICRDHLRNRMGHFRSSWKCHYSISKGSIRTFHPWCQQSLVDGADWRNSSYYTSKSFRWNMQCKVTNVVTNKVR